MGEEEERREGGRAGEGKVGDPRGQPDCRAALG